MTTDPTADPTADTGGSTGTGAPARGWGGGGAATTLLLVRHGVTAHTVDKRFSGGLSGEDPPLSDEGRAQAAATARWLRPAIGDLADVVTSPVRRARETAGILTEVWGRPDPSEEPDVAETDFGGWEGLTFGEVRERHRDDLDAWMASTDHPAGVTGESFATVRQRVLAGLQRLLDAHRGRSVAVVSHVTPIKLVVAEALGAPLDVLYKMELVPASATVVSFYEDPDGGPARASLRVFNARPPEGPPLL